MADGWRCLGFVTAFFVFMITVDPGVSKNNARVGFLFVLELNKKSYQHEFPPFLDLYNITYNDPIEFKCNLQNFPDLPRWLRFTQRGPYDNGYLYGTPTNEDVGRMTIEITAINRRSYDTYRKKEFFIVEMSERRVPYQVDFFIPKKDIEEVLPPSHQKNIINDLQVVWGARQPLEIVNITSALDRGGRVPLPLPNHKEGVYVRVGTHTLFPKCLRDMLSPLNQESCSEENMLDFTCEEWLNTRTEIDWCRSTLIDMTLTTPSAPLPTPGSGILTDSELFEPPDNLEPHDYFPDYIGIVIVPLIVALILCAILAYIMCCRREGLEKRNAQTPDIQLYHHQTIQTNSNELRTIAEGRNAARPLSTLPMFNARTRERTSPVPQSLSSDSPRIPLILAQQEPHSDSLPR
ncbi:alpha-sarcoglycan [Erpetoichthys calabaricus]|uniref:alpha-sarcoglycan n=1 Tax=Erpetoichthys calabaricus TaxID=27687 RepID=UPI00109FBE02|nr:alpha-sarcoglycan [Erpetoichthys calabaricus]